MEIEPGRGRGRGRGITTPRPVEEETELRRPFANPDIRFPGQLISNSTKFDENGPDKLANDFTLISLASANCTLSAEAKEFVPSFGYNAASSLPTISAEAKEFVPTFDYSSPSLSTISAEAKEFVPSLKYFTASSLPTASSVAHSTFTSQQSDIYANPVTSMPIQPLPNQLQYLNHPVILQVDEIVVNLTRKPYALEQSAHQMKSILSYQVKDEKLMREVVSVIFEQGVGAANFRYNGALLAKYLSETVHQSYQGKSFIYLLLNKCMQEFEYRQVYAKTEPDRLIGLTLFLSEMYCQVVTPAGECLSELRSAICILLSCLMDNHLNKENLKCVAQVLKGSGSKLDGHNEQAFENVIFHLKNVAMKAEPEHIRSMLLGVIELRTSNWGRNLETAQNVHPITCNRLPTLRPHLQETQSLPANLMEKLQPVTSIPIQPLPNQLQYLNHPVILQVNDIVVNLTRKPYKFDQSAQQMKSILSYQVKDEKLMMEVVAVIFEQGVGEANFRYNGALLAKYLSENVRQSYEGKSFIYLLMNKCKQEFEYRQVYAKNEPERLIGLTLFLSEVYCHVVTPAGECLSELRSAICALLSFLMDNHLNKENLKCVAQVLKGSGNKLDGHNELVFENVIYCLKDVAMRAEPEHIRSMLFGVIELRASNWGRNLETAQNVHPINERTFDRLPTIVTPEIPEAQSPPANGMEKVKIGPVFYGLEGCNENEYPSSDSEFSDSGSLGEEVADAYEEFLREHVSSD